TNPFYEYIRCLACRYIVSGYNDAAHCGTAIPCFLPFANIVRGQIAKMVSNSAGLLDPIPSTRQTYHDVPFSEPFWVYIERLTAHGVMGGYQCGVQPAGPCDAQNRPYFLTYNFATRGQIAKIDANGAGFLEPIPSTHQTFEDVPYGNPFWV